MERRRCNHHTLDEPLTALECLSSVIDPKGSATNKNRYAVASQEEEVRRFCRGVKGVPLIYVKRSVMILEPMAEGSLDVREGAEREKFRAGLKKRGAGVLAKRKRMEDADGGTNGFQAQDSDGNETLPKKRRVRGPKGPNPLSVKKPKKEQQTGEVHGGDKGAKQGIFEMANEAPVANPETQIDIVEKPLDGQNPTLHRRKRRRKHNSSEFEDLKQGDSTATAVAA